MINLLKRHLRGVFLFVVFVSVHLDLCRRGVGVQLQMMVWKFSF